MSAAEERWVLCPVCGAKTRLRLLRRTILQEFPLFCPKCRREFSYNETGPYFCPDDGVRVIGLRGR